MGNGSGIRAIGRQTSAFAEGDLVVVPPNVPHCWCFTPEDVDSDGMVGSIALMVNPDWLEKAVRGFPKINATINSFIERNTAFVLLGEGKRQILKFLEECVGADEVMLPLKVIECILAVARRTDTVALPDTKVSQNTIDDKLSQIRVYITCNYMRKISLTNAARHIGMSRSLFCSFFKKATGTTFINMVNDCRIDEACRLLKTTTLSVSEISNRVGYSDVSYFNRRFKALKKVSPMKWRIS